jgi:FtsH-binding integral membrane protein
MGMDEDLKVLRDYLAFTVPHVTVLAGALLGVLLILGVSVNTALGIFAVFYGLMLFVLGLVIGTHLSRLIWYRLMMAAFAGLMVVGVFILLYGE